MIRAIRPNAMAQDDAAMVAGWNISPNLAYTLYLTPGSSACGVFLFDADMSTMLASGAALVGTAQPCVLVQNAGTVGMVDADLVWHLLITTDGTETERVIRIGPAVDLPDEIHPIYGEDGLAVVRATAGVNGAAHYIDDLSVTCPLGLGAGLGDIASVPVDGASVVGQVESVTWAGTPNGATESAVVRRHVAIAPEPHVDPVPITPPDVADDEAETDAETEASGNVLANDDAGLVIVAVNGLVANVGEPVTGSNGGVFTVAEDGAWTFDPDGDFDLLDGSETAETSVTYHASDGVSEAMATLAVTVSSGAAMPWTPAEITTALWLDTASTAVTVESGKVAQRDDLSGNGRHATQPTSGQRPTSGTNKDVYDGTDDRMVVADDDALDSAAYICCVCKPTVTAQFQGLLDKWDSSAGWMIEFGPTATLGRPRLSVNGSAIVAPTSVSGVNTIVEAQINGASSFIGTPAGVTTGTLPSPTATTQDLFINGDGTSTLATALDFYELIILPAAPDAATRQRIQGYTAHKWDGLLGVTTFKDALPSDHPHKSSPPTV